MPPTRKSMILVTLVTGLIATFTDAIALGQEVTAIGV